MPKTLIAVVSAAHRVEWREAIRSTWLPQVPLDKADVVFFVGRGMETKEGLVRLDCDDSYQGLPEKVRAIAKWSFDHGYQHMLKCDDDTVLRPVELLNSSYERHKYSGRANRFPGRTQAYTVPVGFNWWIDRECMAYVSVAELPTNGSNDDEKWVASVLHRKGISLTNVPGYEIHCGYKYPDRPPSRIYRPAPPAPLPGISDSALSWTIFLEADSGNSVPLEQKISEFKSTFAKIQQQQ